MRGCTNKSPTALLADLSHLTNITTKTAYLMKHPGLGQKNSKFAQWEQAELPQMTLLLQKSIEKVSIYEMRPVSCYLLVTFSCAYAESES